jgi:hypothetical protein
MFTKASKAFGLVLALGSLCGTAWAQSGAQQAPGSGSLPGSGGSSVPPPPPSRILYSDGGGQSCFQGNCGNGGCGNLCNGNCGDSGCNNNCCCGSGFQAGAELHVLRPVITNNAGLIFSTSVEEAADPTTRIANFSFDYAEAPSVWVGYVNDCGLGGRITWFHFYERSKALTAVQDPDSDTIINTPSNFFRNDVIGSGEADFSASNTLSIDAWDFDVTQCFKVCKLELTVGAGLRYFHLNQNYVASRVHNNVADEEIVTSYTEEDANSFNGWGPTLLCNAYRPIGCSGFGLYADSRIGLLFGDRHESCFQQHIGFEEDNNLNETTSDSDQLIGFLEIEFGVQWTGQYGCTHPFVRLGIEGRGYFGTGNAQSGAVFSTNNLDIEANSLLGVPSLGKTSDLGLYGFTFAAGIAY